MHATDFIILRNVTSNSRITRDVARKPAMVATLIDEEKFVASGHRLTHLDTVFFEDFLHDWHWEDGKFRYTSRVADDADIVLVYATDTTGERS